MDDEKLWGQFSAAQSDTYAVGQRHEADHSPTPSAVVENGAAIPHSVTRLHAVALN
jgi:hypothetical protein